MTRNLTLHTRTIASGSVIELTGELDHHTAPEVRDALSALRLCAGQQLVLDLDALTFCDSTGITVLIAARNRVLAAGAGIVLVAVPDRVSRVFRLVGLDRVFPTRPTARDAEADWRPAVD